jgi:hypothetical protein
MIHQGTDYRQQHLANLMIASASDTQRGNSFVQFLTSLLIKRILHDIAYKQFRASMSMRAGAKLGHSAPRERRSAAE